MSTSKHTIGSAGVSLLLRLPSDGTSIERVAKAHNEIIIEHGSVWLGIVGKTYSAENVRLIRKNGEFLYLAQNTSDGTTVYRGEIVDFSKNVPDAQKYLIPTYYRDMGIAERAGLWVKLSSLRGAASHEIEMLRVVSSGKSAAVLLSGMAYFGMVMRK